MTTITASYAKTITVNEVPPALAVTMPAAHTVANTTADAVPPGSALPALPHRAPAMILAAGKGQRMQPLTLHTPKPLLLVQGKPLLQWHLEALARAGVRRVVINAGWLGEQIATRWGHAFASPAGDVQLHYSREDLDFGGGIETAGGIARALPWLVESFWLVAADAYMPGFVFDEERRHAFAQSGLLAHLWLVANPAHNPKGDFGLSAQGMAVNPLAAAAGEAVLPTYTYSTVALLSRALFEPPWCEIPPGNPSGESAALAPLLRKAMDAGRVSAEIYRGSWVDVGTPERLAEINAQRD